MSDKIRKSDAELRKIIADSGAVDFQRLGKIVTEVTPGLLAASDTAEEYLISVGDNLLRVYNLGLVDEMKVVDRVEDLKKVTGKMTVGQRELKEGQVPLAGRGDIRGQN